MPIYWLQRLVTRAIDCAREQLSGAAMAEPYSNTQCVIGRCCKKHSNHPPKLSFFVHYLYFEDNGVKYKRLHTDTAAEEPPTRPTCTLLFASISTINVNSNITFHTAVQYCGSTILPLYHTHGCVISILADSPYHSTIRQHCTIAHFKLFRDHMGTL